MNTKPLWIDVSRHQGRIDFVQMLKMVDCKPRELHGVVIRAGVGLEKDVQFERNWLKFKDIYRSSYWALHPDKNVNDQLDDWYQVNPEILGIPRTIDLERDGGKTANEIADMTLHWSDVILSRDGVRPWIYSRKNLIDLWLDSWTYAELLDHYYMLAEYNAGDGKEYDGIRLPNRVDASRVLLKQTTDKMTLYPGSGAIDRDRWLPGDVRQMNDFLNSTYFGNDTPNIPVGDCATVAYVDKVNNDLLKEIDANAAEVEKVNLRCDGADADWLEVEDNIEALTANALIAEEQLFQDDDALKAQKQAIDEMWTEIIQIKQEFSVDMEGLELEILDAEKDLEREIGKLNRRIDSLAGGHTHFWLNWFK